MLWRYDINFKSKGKIKGSKILDRYHIVKAFKNSSFLIALMCRFWSTLVLFFRHVHSYHFNHGIDKLSLLLILTCQPGIPHDLSYPGSQVHHHYQTMCNYGFTCLRTLVRKLLTCSVDEFWFATIKYFLTVV